MEGPSAEYFVGSEIDRLSTRGLPLGFIFLFLNGAAWF